MAQPSSGEIFAAAKDGNTDKVMEFLAGGDDLGEAEKSKEWLKNVVLENAAELRAFALSLSEPKAT